MASYSVVLDNGADTVKLWHSRDGVDGPIYKFTNAVVRCKDDRRTFVGRYFDEAGAPFDGALLGTLQYRRPVERGYLCNWETERAVWQAGFADDYADVEPADALLVATEPLGNLPVLKANMDEVVFEEFGFAEYLRIPAHALCAHGSLGERAAAVAPGAVPEAPLEACVVVDCGFSSTSCVPVVDGVAWESHARRLAVGGKFLTNWLKEQLSFRQYNLMEEYPLVDRCKQAACYLAANFNADMEYARRAAVKLAGTGIRDDIVARYALPDFAKRKPDRLLAPGDAVSAGSRRGGEAEDDVQYLQLANERFRTPELLFRPSDAGVRSGGVAELVAQTIAAVADPVLRALMWENVIVVGGSSRFAGFEQRLTAELGVFAPQGQPVRIWMPESTSATSFGAAGSAGGSGAGGVVGGGDSDGDGDGSDGMDLQQTEPLSDATTYACRSGAQMVSSPYFQARRRDLVVSRAEWQESGRRITTARFDDARRDTWPRARYADAFGSTGGQADIDHRHAGTGTAAGAGAGGVQAQGGRRSTIADAASGSATPSGGEIGSDVKKSIYVEEDVPDTPRSFSPDTVASDEGDVKMDDADADTAADAEGAAGGAVGDGSKKKKARRKSGA